MILGLLASLTLSSMLDLEYLWSVAVEVIAFLLSCYDISSV